MIQVSDQQNLNVCTTQWLSCGHRSWQCWIVYLQFV